MGRRVLTVLLCAVAVAGVVACTPARDLVIQDTIVVGDAEVDVEIADTAEKRSNGLQGVKQPPPGSGMLFVWEQPLETTFAIMDVSYPVDIVWIDPSLTVVGVATVSPDGPKDADSPGAVQVVLELASGEADRLGIKVGDVARAVEETEGPEDLPRPGVGETLPSEATGTP